MQGVQHTTTSNQRTTVHRGQTCCSHIVHTLEQNRRARILAGLRMQDSCLEQGNPHSNGLAAEGASSIALAEQPPQVWCPQLKATVLGPSMHREQMTASSAARSLCARLTSRSRSSCAPLAVMASCRARHALPRVPSKLPLKQQRLNRPQVVRPPEHMTQ